jgi:hypothetical protein
VFIDVLLETSDDDALQAARGSIVAAREGDMEAAQRAKSIARLLLEEHRQASPTVEPDSPLALSPRRPTPPSNLDRALC